MWPRPLILIFSILVVTGAFAQTTTEPERKDPRPLKDRIWFGGGLGLSFGTVTAIQIDPLIGYKVDQAGKFSLGVGGSYWHFRDNRFPGAEPFIGFGYRTFARYRVIQPLFLHAEFLHMNVDVFNQFDSSIQRLWVPHLLVGGGYVQSLAGRSSIFLQVLFDVLQDPNSIYAGRGPMIMGGVGIGF